MGIKPTSSVWKTEAQSLRQPRVFIESVVIELAGSAGVEPTGHCFGGSTDATTSTLYVRRSGVADRIRTGYNEGHNLALFLSSLSHTATANQDGAARRNRTASSRIQAGRPTIRARRRTWRVSNSPPLGYQPSVQPAELQVHEFARRASPDAAAAHVWRARWGLNPQPLGYEPSSLPLDLRAHILGGRDGTRTRNCPGDNRVPCLRASRPRSIW